MKLGIIGLPFAGKSTIFEALTRSPSDPAKKAENRMAMVDVPDERINRLSEMYKPRKTIFARVEYFLPGVGGSKDDKAGAESAQLTAVRSCDALILVLRNFETVGMPIPDPNSDYRKVDEELIFADLVVVEKRLERFALDKQRAREIDKEEQELLLRCKNLLEDNHPIRQDVELATAPKLRGFTFLSSKPLLLLVNNSDEDDSVPTLENMQQTDKCLAIRGQIEHEIAQMDDEDAAEFLKEYHISEPATRRMLRESYALLGLISFFTVGDDEVRAWTIPSGTQAVDSAEVIHSDIKKGFIRAELVAYNDLMEAGNYAEARKHGTVRLEGKTYIVQDGNIINFRFNV